jgi:hypothetical protein
MIEERIKDGEAINDDSWLFRSHSQTILVTGNKRVFKIKHDRPGLPLTSLKMNKIIVNIAERAGLQRHITTALGKKKAEVHAHTFRSYWHRISSLYQLEIWEGKVDTA